MLLSACVILRWIEHWAACAATLHHGDKAAGIPSPSVVLYLGSHRVPQARRGGCLLMFDKQIAQKYHEALTIIALTITERVFLVVHEAPQQ